jgi:hypothetical protein
MAGNGGNGGIGTGNGGNERMAGHHIPGIGTGNGGISGMAPTCSRTIPSFRKWTNPGFNSWTVTIDLGWQNHICGVAIAWFNQFGRSYGYTISTSLTGTFYHTVYQGTHLQERGIQYSHFSDELARYVRINVYGTHGNPIMFIDIMNNG